MPFQGKNTTKTMMPVIVILLVVGLFFAFLGIDFLVNNAGNNAPKKPDVFVGVDVGFGDENDVYRVADAIQGYANLLILGSSALTSQTENLTRVCDYLYQRGFSFIVYIGFSVNETGFPPKGPDSKFFNQNVGRWGESLLGLYMFDEPGGKQADNTSSPVPKANNIHDAAVHFRLGVEPYTSLYRGETYYAAETLGLYTSDYALYWFDYISGYNTVFGEFVGNESRQIAVALNRGAAETLGKDWGTMITWKYDSPPYLENAGELYDDMVLAYENEAKYIVVFDSPGGTPPNPNPPITPYGILTEDHISAIKQFWDYAMENPRTEIAVDTAYVLPRDWGFGFRGPNDTIWGLWPADSLAPKVWNDTQALLAEHGKNLDIVYETRIDNVDITLPYSTLIFWNGTTVKR